MLLNDKKLIVAPFLIMVLSTFLLIGCSEKIEPGKAKVSRQKGGKVNVEEVRSVDKEKTYVAVGTVRAVNGAIISPQVAGRIIEIHVSEGKKVKKGALLLKIDDSAMVAEERSARSMVDEAESALLEVKAAIAQAKSNMDLAEKTYNRFKPLLDERVISRQEFDEIETRRSVAQDNLKMVQAKENRLEARLRHAEARLESVRVSLAYTELKAPFDGVVAKKYAELGSMASPGNPLFILDEEGGYQLQVEVSEQFSGYVKKGTPARVSVESARIVSVKTKVAEIVPALDPSTRSFSAKIGLPPGSGLRSGMFGRASFSLGLESVLAVPETFLVRVGGYRGVYVIREGNVARFIMVRTGSSFDGMVEILSGLSEGDIIALNSATISDGAVVEVEQ